MNFLDKITPVILTYNEAPNIGRVLDCLPWAEKVVVVDSYSTDETLELLSGFEKVEMYQSKLTSVQSQ